MDSNVCHAAVDCGYHKLTHTVTDVLGQKQRIVQRNSVQNSNIHKAQTHSHSHTNTQQNPYTTIIRSCDLENLSLFLSPRISLNANSHCI